MPYQLSAAKVRGKLITDLWEDADLSLVDINTIFKRYRQVWLKLTHTSLPDPVYLDLMSVRALIPPTSSSITLTQWFVSRGNASLPHVSSYPEFDMNSAKWANVWEAGYTVQPVDRLRTPQAEIPNAAKNDLLLTRGTVDFRNWWKYCLVTVNGFVHRVQGAQEGLYVVDGGRTGRIGNDNHVGIYSFREVGAMKVIPITPAMIYKRHVDDKHKNYMHLKMPVSLENKLVILVLGGYLHVMDRSFRITTDKTIRIDFNNLNLIARIFESRRNINLESLQLDVAEANPEQIDVEDLYSDRALTAYACLPQSFVAIIDTPEGYVRRHAVEKSGLPGRFLTPMPHKPLPLVSSLGRIYDYQARPEAGRCVLATDHAREFNLNFATMPWRLSDSVDESHYRSKPWRFAKAHQLEIGRFG